MTERLRDGLKDAYSQRRDLRCLTAFLILKIYPPSFLSVHCVDETALNT